MRVVWSIAIVLAAAAAQERSQPPEVRQQPDGGAATVPLSNEDAELVKELAVIERLELLRNLELFEEQKEAKKPQEQ
ncbi:MAG: hypothetical protein E6J66_19980 [Deltaproteobacteria bacterium]|nr:MAG: hypothetical protein E6J66_19980 [Deltaproteobacteria bacterium]HMC36053.1 hypothetical protein [Myxococcales bacterium]